MFHQPFGDRESQPGTLAHAFGGDAGLAEAFKDRLLILRLNSDSRVAHQNADRSFLTGMIQSKPGRRKA